MKKIYFILTVAVLLALPVLAFGATVKTGESYYLDPGSTIDDNLYSAGGMVGILGNVNGDLIAVGGTISASGEVLGDIAAAGGNIDIRSSIFGDVRVAGGNISILSPIGGDLLAAGGQISILPGTLVGRDAKIAGGSVYINAEIDGNLSVAAEEIRLGPKAVIKGNFDYYSQKQATVEDGASIQGGTNFHKTKVPVKPTAPGALFAGFLTMAWIIKLLALTVAALVIIYFFRPQANAIVEKSVSNFWKELLKGFAVLVLVPVAVVLSFVTVIGSALGIITMLFYIAFIAISSIVAILIFAKLCLKYILKKENYKLNWLAVIISALVFSLLSIIPFVGWIFAFIIFLSALGAVSDFIYKKIRG